MSNSKFNTEDIHTPEDGYRELANHIIVQAAEDYRKVKKKLNRNPDDKKALSEFNELEDFFKSAYCDSLTTLDPLIILRGLQKETPYNL